MSARTENGAVAESTTQDARLDLFFKTVRDIVVDNDQKVGKYNSDSDSDSELGSEQVGLTGLENLNNLIAASWKVDPLDTMKILFNWRDCRGGKGDRYAFLMAMKYVEANHLQWFQANAHLLPKYGRYLDLIHSWYLVSSSKSFIMKIIADQLKDDITNLKNGDESTSVSLLAKWIPSENAKFDRLVKGHPRFYLTLCKEFLGKAHVKNDDLKSMRQQYMTPLRKRINLVETHLCKKDYASIDYETVPSVAMNRYRNAFRKNDQDRFSDYFDKLKLGIKKINADQVYPHDLVRHYLQRGSYDEVVEAQWKVLKEKADKTGAFENSISVVDVSGSMNGTPMEVAIALGLLGVNESNQNSVITFSSDPSLRRIHPGSLEDQVKNIRGMAWGMNTNIEKCFELILKMSQGQSTPIKKLFIFSDMQFDSATGSKSKTHFQLAQERFRQAELELPAIIFWNLRGNTNNFPVTHKQLGVMMLSGYSPSLLKGILDGKDMDPLNTMLNIIRDPRYDDVKAPEPA